MALPIPPPDGAAGLARRLGTTAFAAYVVLAFDVERRNDGRLLVAVSARRLAVRLGVGKDTAADALRRLSDAGLLLAAPRQDEETGRFTVAVRELRPVPGIGPCRHSGDMASVATPNRRRRAKPVEDDAQLGLFVTMEGTGAHQQEVPCLQSQDLLNQTSQQPSLFNQCLQPSNRSLLNQSSSRQTRLHRGCEEEGDSHAPRHFSRRRACLHRLGRTDSEDGTTPSVPSAIP
jgi:hypothetical protein